MKIGFIPKNDLGKKDADFEFGVYGKRGAKETWNPDAWPPIKVVILTWDEYKELNRYNGDKKGPRCGGQGGNDIELFF